jgi:hypothetical protein
MSETETPPEPAIEPAPIPVIEPAALPPPVPPAEPKSPAPRPKRGVAGPLLVILGFLILAGGEGYLYQLYHTLPRPTDNSAQIAGLQAQISALQQAEKTAAASPAPTPMAAPAPAPTAPPDQNLANQLASLSSLVNALQTQANADHTVLNTLQASNADLPKFQAAVTALQAQAVSDHTALTTLQTSTADLTALTSKISTLSRLATARMALDAGQPLGDIPNAPPALAQFATTPPPTQAALVLAYPAAAQAASAANIAGNATGSYWSRVLARLENLITISNGSHVIVGAPAAAVLAQAQQLLNAGDLAGAVTTLDQLSPTTQQAMGAWLAQARALLAARAAIGTLADPS